MANTTGAKEIRVNPTSRKNNSNSTATAGVTIMINLVKVCTITFPKLRENKTGSKIEANGAVAVKKTIRAHNPGAGSGK